MPFKLVEQPARGRREHRGRSTAFAAIGASQDVDAGTQPGVVASQSDDGSGVWVSREHDPLLLGDMREDIGAEVSGEHPDLVRGPAALRRHDDQVINAESHLP